MPTPTIKGIATIRWGTGSASDPVTTPKPVITGATQTNLATAIVVSVKAERMGGAPIIIEEGSGFSTVWVGLNDGWMYEIEYVDDTTIVGPVFGDTVKLYVVGATAVSNFICEDNNPSLKRKGEGTRILKARYYVNITVS
jgi:hypothetical protein